ncbi:MAG: succinylglutamate desuccinylase/aspartoacylase family protein [Alphaproteobacteria bacterium]|nr:succinylglutamate desuccinylase/aspartoacylase family protein [Alphaproteobacteria bacterium]
MGRKEGGAPSPVVAEIDFDRPGRQFGTLRVPSSRNDSGWGTIAVPIVQIKAGRGPTVLFTAGNHGDEYEGQIALSNLARKLDPRRVSGRVILLPAMHLPAVMNGTRLSPLDGRDFNRSFPGNPRGSFAEVLAHFVDSRLLPLCDFQMDLHSGGIGADLVPCAAAHALDDKAYMAKTLAAANAFNAPITLVLHEPNAGPTLLAAAERRGIPALSSELGGGARVNIDGVAITERGVRNVLQHYGVVAGKPAPDPVRGPSRVMTVPDLDCYVFAPQAGLFQPADPIGTVVKAGRTAGWLHFMDQPRRPPARLVYGTSGLLWCARHQARCQRGDPVAVIAKDL